MRAYSIWMAAAFFLSALICSALCAIAADIVYEPCYVFEVEESLATRVGDPMSKKHSYFTAAELPWTPLELAPKTELFGFVSSEEKEELVVGDEKHQTTKVTWKRDPQEEFPTIRASLVRFWISDEFSTPLFEARISRGPGFFIPRGCVKFEVVAHQAGAVGIMPDEIAESFTATGEYLKPGTFQLGDKSYPTQIFTYTGHPASPPGTRTLALSGEIPGGVCGMRLVNEQFTVITRITAMSLAPEPENLDVFEKDGFAFAPPADYKKAAQPASGEIVRYVRDDRTYLSVSPIDLGGAGLAGYQAHLQSAGDDPKVELVSTGQSRDRHLAGHASFNAQDIKTQLSYIITEYAGRGYKIGNPAFDEMTGDEVRALLSGWRWISVERQ